MNDEMAPNIPDFLQHMHLILSQEIQNYIQGLREIIEAQAKELAQPAPYKPRRIGVTYRKSRDKWYARYQINGRQVCQGFDNYEDAVRARQLAEFRFGNRIRRSVYPLTEIEVNVDYVTTKVRQHH